MALAQVHGDCVNQVAVWYSIASRVSWHDLSEVRRTFPSADIVGDKTVFNINGNAYRLIVYIQYEAGIIYIKDLLTHVSYDKGNWKV